MNSELRKIINKLKKNKEFSIYLQGPPFILYYMDKMRMEYDRDSIEEKLYCLWICIKAIDLEVEKNIVQRKEFLDVFLGKKSKKRTLGIKLVQVLRRFVKTKTLKKEFVKLYKNVCKEKDSKNIKELVFFRRKNGDSLARIIRELIKEDIKKEHKYFDDFLHESLKMNQLMDSYVDLEDDYKTGELKFKPTRKDLRFLRVQLFKDVLRNSKRYPLTGFLLLSGIFYLRKMKK